MIVLLVEDNAILAMAIQDELESAGHTVIGPAWSAAEARTLLLANAIEMALVDIDLQDGRTGGDLAKEIKYSHACPVIFTTGQQHMAEAWQDYAFGCLEKPFDPKVVVTIIDVFEQGSAGKAADWPYQFIQFAKMK